MNGIQLTFFNFSGYLIPGLVLTLAFLPIMVVYPSVGYSIAWLLDIANLTPLGLTGAPLVAAVFLPALATAFLLGVILSDTAMWLMTEISLSAWRPKSSDSSGLYHELVDKGRAQALRENYMLREMISLKATGGWDFYAAAGRARMLTASGLGFIIAAVVYVPASWLVAGTLALIGAYTSFLGRNLSKYNNDMCEILAFLESSQETSMIN